MMPTTGVAIKDLTPQPPPHGGAFFAHRQQQMDYTPALAFDETP